MSKRIFLLFIPLLLSFQKDKEIVSILLNENGPEILNGNVKRLTITYDKGDEISMDSSAIIFDKLGNIFRKEEQSHGNKYRTDFITKYDHDNRKIKILGFVTNLTKYPVGFLDKDTATMDTTVKVKCVYKYNKREIIIKYTFNTDKSSGGSYFYKYNSDGQIIESDYYIQPKQLLKRLKYKYDNKHHLIELDHFSNKNFLEYKDLYSYKSFDLKNNWIKVEINSEGFYSGGVQKIIVNRKITYY